MMVFSPLARRGIVLLLVVLMLAALGACKQNPVTPESSSEEPSSVEPEIPQTEEPVFVPEPEIEATSFDKAYSTADGIEILSLSYALPKIENADEYPSLCMINSYYEAELQRLVDAGQGELLGTAQTAAQDGMLFGPYADEENYTEEYRSESRISFVRTHSSYTGGAHPNYVLFSDNFDYTTGLKLTAADFFTVPAETYTARILQEILKQIEANGAENYMGGYQEFLPQIFNPDQFYLTDEGLVFYFQPYDIAPYAAGVPSFLIPYSELEDILKTWS